MSRNPRLRIAVRGGKAARMGGGEKNRGGATRWTVDGHGMTLLPDGPDRLEALLALIDGARRSLRILYYIFEGDTAGTRVRDALIAAGARGVSVSLLVDGFGSGDAPSDFFDPLTRSAGKICRYEPRWGRRYLLRNHQKIALADEERVIIGGFNIADEYFGTVESGAWRDLGLLVEGPAAARLAAYFDALLDWAGQPRSKTRDLRQILRSHSETSGPLQWLFGGPTRRLSPWAKAVCRDLRGARRMSMVAAYFGPNPAMLRRMGSVARRGRGVEGGARLISAAKSDNGATVGAARFTYNRLLRQGVEIYEYQPTKLHSKLVVIDNVVHIGSANFDMRSMYLNLELMLRIDDRAFAASMNQFIDGEIAQSERITPALHKARATLWTRITWAASRFIVATMDYNVSRRLNFGLDAR